MNLAAFQPREILRVLGEHDVECVVLGAIAATLHGAPFTTNDLDICPEGGTRNLERLSEALHELDGKMMAADEPEGLNVAWSAKSLSKWLVEFKFLNIQTKYGQLDLLYRPAGTDGYSDLKRNAVREEIGEVTITVAALGDVIRSKQAAGRPRDLEQLPTLRNLLAIKRTEGGGPSNEVTK
jgi:hypothetical protein